MKKYSKIIISMLFVSVLAGTPQLHAQAVLQEAEKAWYEADYFNAAKFYGQYVTGKRDSISKTTFNPYAHATGSMKKPAFATNVPGRITWRLAESYRMLHDYAHAQDWYKKVAENNNVEFPLAQYWYAVSLRANENFAAAEEAMDIFVKEYKGNDNYTDAAARELKNLKFINSQKQKGFSDVYIVTKFDGTGLTSNGNFAPLVDGQKFIFTGIYTDSTLLKKKNVNPYFNRLYETTTSNEPGKQGSLINISGANAGQHQGAAAITPDGKGLFFTQWEKKNGKTFASIWYAANDNGQWTNATTATGLNKEGYNTMQPFVTADGKYLLFSSNRPGGSGGYDLWYIQLASGNAMTDTALNMGRTINTNADEQTPFYAQRINRLVFSTNGRTGMGGYDIFSAKGTFGKWGEPVNMGYPVNSVKDDQYFYSSSNADIFSEAWFSSDRGSDCCLELYSAKQLPRNKTLVGVLLDCATGKPLSRGMIYLKDPVNGERTDSTFTDRDGKYILPIGQRDNLQLLAERRSYNSNTSHVSVAALSLVDDINDVLTNTDICLQPEPVDATPRIIRDRVIYFDFDKSNLKTAAVSELDSMVHTLQEFPAAVFEVGGYTDEAGTDDYNIKLGLKRANTAAAYLKAHGISADRILIKSYGKLYGDKNMSKAEAGRWNRKVRMVILSGR
jgi:OmpA-OmpF porin, OOP family